MQDIQINSFGDYCVRIDREKNLLNDCVESSE